MIPAHLLLILSIYPHRVWFVLSFIMLTLHYLSNESMIHVPQICSSLLLFYSHHAIKPITVKLPNRSHIIFNKSGTVKLNENLTLYNVLFVPDFNCNLISAYQLSSSNQCSLLFYHCSCVIQAQPSLRIIGLAKVYNNLYLLSQDFSFFNVYNNHVTMKSCNYNVSTKFSLWHYRLGHPSYNVINKIKQIFPIVFEFSNIICDCCH